VISRGWLRTLATVDPQHDSSSSGSDELIVTLKPVIAWCEGGFESLCGTGQRCGVCRHLGLYVSLDGLVLEVVAGFVTSVFLQEPNVIDYVSCAGI
jgi:hypothetical protein